MFESQYQDNPDDLERFDGESTKDYLTRRMRRRIASMREHILNVEDLVELSIRSGHFDILTDKNGYFSYVLTKSGRDIFTQQTGLPAPTRDMSFFEMI